MSGPAAHPYTAKVPPGPLNADLVVHKFGGTSVSALQTLLSLVKAIPEAHKVIVCSAFSGITDQLLGCIAVALESGPASVDAHFDAVIRAPHFKHISDLEAQGASMAAARPAVEALLRECQDLLKGVALLRECSLRSRDNIIAYGELLSCPMVAAALCCPYVDSRKLIRSDELFGCVLGEGHGEAMH